MRVQPWTKIEGLVECFSFRKGFSLTRKMNMAGHSKILVLGCQAS